MCSTFFKQPSSTAALRHRVLGANREQRLCRLTHRHTHQWVISDDYFYTLFKGNRIVYLKLKWIIDQFARLTADKKFYYVNAKMSKMHIKM